MNTLATLSFTISLPPPGITGYFTGLFEIAVRIDALVTQDFYQAYCAHRLLAQDIDKG
jgi:hypothetical protein